MFSASSLTETFLRGWIRMQRLGVGLAALCAALRDCLVHEWIPIPHPIAGAACAAVRIPVPERNRVRMHAGLIHTAQVADPAGRGRLVERLHNADAFCRMLTGRLNLPLALVGRKVKLRGDLRLFLRMNKLFSVDARP